MCIPINSLQVRLLYHSDLRPYEELRHTPIIPISDKDMQRHNEHVAAANRKGYFLEIKKDALYFYGKSQITSAISMMIVFVLFYTFTVMNEKTMSIKMEIDKTRAMKTTMREGSRGAALVSDR
jgi:hypothetical protein